MSYGAKPTSGYDTHLTLGAQKCHKKSSYAFVQMTFFVEDIERTKSVIHEFSLRLPVSELWRQNHFRVAENAIRKHDTGFMHKGFIVEDIKRTKVAMDNFSVRLPVSELWRENHFRVAENAIRKHAYRFYA